MYKGSIMVKVEENGYGVDIHACIHPCMPACMHGWMDGWMHGWMVWGG